MDRVQVAIELIGWTLIVGSLMILMANAIEAYYRRKRIETLWTERRRYRSIRHDHIHK